jgi:PAS domain S-box-containing protein
MRGGKGQNPARQALTLGHDVHAGRSSGKTGPRRFGIGHPLRWRFSLLQGSLLGPMLPLLLFTRTRRELLSEQQSQALLDLPEGGIVLLDEEQVVRFSNSAIGGLLGYQRDEILGRPLSDLLTPPSGESLRQMLAGHAPGRARVSGELRGIRKDGRSVPLQAVMQEFRADGQRVFGVYLRDLTEREELVEALAHRAAELARSNRELEQFTYIASHDLQEPLRMVGSYTQLLMNRYGNKLDADAHQFLEYAQEGAVRMRLLIDDLLAYSRLGTRAEPFRRVSVEKILAQALGNLREAIRETKAEVVSGPMPELDGDFTQLVQVFQNLIGNALKFHGTAVPEVRISADKRASDWIFSVRDNGIGIPEEYKDRIFVIFQRLHTREEYPGTGIGLAVCKKVVERHGGTIWVESTGELGKGTTFYFTLPLEHKPLPRVPEKEADPKDAEVKLRAMNLIEDRLRDLV